MTIALSVVIGTYNRVRFLEQTLKSLDSQRAPDSLAWEIVVVDNNSTDTTAQVVKAFSKWSIVPLHYVFEPHQGLSHARNRGIQESHGSIIAFTDDDVLPELDWISGICAALDRWRADGVGGRVLPKWEVSPPEWIALNRDLLNYLAILDSEESHLLSLHEERLPEMWGANMAFRRKVFDKVGVFEPELGVRGKKLFRGEESELITRALRGGLRIAYDARRTVFHQIGRDRMRRGYFRKLVFDKAEGEARFRPAVSGRTLWGAPLWLYRLTFTNFWSCLVRLLLRRPNAFERQLRWLSFAGQLCGYWRSSRSRNSG